MRDTIKASLARIFEGINALQQAFPARQFTIDGRLVGDIGEVIAELEYDVQLDAVSRPGHDARTPDGRQVQVKATFKNSLTFRTCPDYYLGFKLYPNGEYDEVYNGPGSILYNRWKSRKGIGVQLLSFPVEELRRLSAQVNPADRIAKRRSLR